MNFRLLLFQVFLFCLPGFCLNHLSGQSTNNLRFDNISKANGLSSNYINDIVKDNFGFIWIATNDGLCRYDGPDKITVFKADSTNHQNGLVSSYIQTLFLDSHSNLWIGTRFGGLTRYDQKNNEWKTFLHDVKDEQTINHNEVLSIAEDGQQRIWVGTETGLNLFESRTQTFRRYNADGQTPNSLKGKAVLSIFFDNKGSKVLG